MFIRNFGKILLLLLVVNDLWAESADDVSAQEFIRQQQQGQAIREKMEKSTDVHLETQRIDTQKNIPDNELPCFHISHIELAGTGADFFKKTLKKVLKNSDQAVGRCLGVEGINVVMTRLQNEIIANGYITSRVYAGPQDLTKGTLTLTVVAGTVNDVYTSDDTSSFIFLWNTLPRSKDGLLNLRDIEQALENFKRVPTADANIAILPSKNQQQGESDLEVSYQQRFPLRFSLSLDDAGSKATGKYQGNLTASLDNPLRLSDLLYVSMNHDLGGGDSGSRGSESKILHYSVPYQYWQVAITGNESDYYQSVPGLTETYIYSGRNKQVEIKLSRLVWRNAQSKVTLFMQGHHKKSWNYIDDTEVEVQRRVASGWTTGANYRTRFSTAIWDINLAYKRGTGAFGAMRAPEEMYGEGTTRYQIINADTYIMLPFSVQNFNFRYSASARIQIQQTPLLPQERFSIGGRYSVRGFDGESSLMGEKGFSIRNDLGWVLNGQYKELYLGLDAGRVSGTRSSSLQGKTLVGTVLGFKGTWRGFSYDFFYGTDLYKPSKFASQNPFEFALNYSF